MKHIIRSSTGALLVCMIAAGCATKPSSSEVAAANTSLGNAGVAIDRASADPHVAKYASSELERAQDSMQKANKAWNDKHDVKTTMNYAYLAQQRAVTAQELANERAAHEVVAVAAANRDSALRMVATEKGGGTTTVVTTTELVQHGLPGFATGKATLPPKSMHQIDQLVVALKNAPDTKVVIEGHTDNVGKPDFNQTLAMKRAESVRSALVRHGIAADRISIRAHGEDNPVASNDTSAGRRENRRADIIIGGTETAVMGSSGTAGSTGSGGGQSGQSGQSGQNGQSGQSAQDGQGDQGGQRQE
jgi:outer membrane protein OmpA-like peptidoglycan-associated protein